MSEEERNSEVGDSVSSTDVGRSAAMMSGLVIVSRLTGFVRTWAQAYALGVTVLASCYAVANNLPTQLYEIVIGGILVTAFLPVYMSIKQREGKEAANEYTSNLTSIVVLLMGLLTILCFIFAAQIVWTQSFSASEDFDFDLAVYFFRFFVIEVLLYALSSVFSGVLNAERNYFWSSAAPIFNNLVTTASFLLYAWMADTNPQLALIILALGNPLGVAVQVIVQIPSLKRQGVELSLRVNFSDPALKETLQIGVPTLVVMLCSFATVSVMTSSALSVVPEAASISAYARLWFTLPYAILAVPITTAMFTELSDSITKGDTEAYKEGIRSGISKINFYLIPFAMYLIVFAVPLTTLLSAGRFSESDIAITASYLQVLSISLPFYGISAYLQKVFSAIRRMGAYAVAHVVAAIIQTIMCFTLTPIFGLNLVPFSSTIYMIAVDIISFIELRDYVKSSDYADLFVSCIRSLAFGLVGSLVGFVILGTLGGVLSSRSMRPLISSLLLVVAGGIPALLATYGVAFVLKAPEVQAIRDLLSRFLGGS